ncbi:MAG: energy transducer TonB [Candidatus Saccharicenans sp.]|nr:energy transducer TonB [Candidatus Saccharicenans sp.]
MKKVIGILQKKRETGTQGFKQKREEKSCQSEARLQAVRKVNLEKLPRPEVFRDSFIVLSKNFKLIILAVAISGLIHLMAGALLIGVPLMNPGTLPPVQVYSAFLAPMPSPTPPPAPPKGSPRGAGKKTPVMTRPSAAPGVLVAPVDIPEEIPEEGIVGQGDKFGVSWGVDYGEDEPVWGEALKKIITEPVTSENQEPVRASGEIKPPRLIRRIDPVYPEIARQARKEGIVILEATTDIYGRVVSIRVLRSEPFLDDAAIEAVRQWVYEPMVINGRPRSVTFTVTVIFKLQK